MFLFHFSILQLKGKILRIKWDLNIDAYYIFLGLISWLLYFKQLNFLIRYVLLIYYIIN